MCALLTYKYILIRIMYSGSGQPCDIVTRLNHSYTNLFDYMLSMMIQPIAIHSEKQVCKFVTKICVNVKRTIKDTWIRMEWEIKSLLSDLEVCRCVVSSFFFISWKWSLQLVILSSIDLESLSLSLWKKNSWQWF